MFDIQMFVIQMFVIQMFVIQMFVIQIPTVYLFRFTEKKLDAVKVVEVEEVEPAVAGHVGAFRDLHRVSHPG